MEKRSSKRKIFRALLIIASTPVIIIGMLATLLYIPPVQRYIIDYVCEDIRETTGYKIEIGSVELTFPLKLKATDITVSKNDTIYLQGERLNADISLLPLFTGNLEVNYISLEGIDINSHDLMRTSRIDGRIGYARAVLRDLDLSESVADIRQFHIQESDIRIIELGSNREKEPDDDDAMSNWIINLRNSDIKDSRVKIEWEENSTSAEVDIETLELKDGCANTIEGSITIGGIAMNASRLNYNMGDGTQQESPLKHIELENIVLNAGDILYADDDFCASVTNMTLEQPGGFAVTNATASLISKNDTIQLQELDIYSRNGSHIHGEFIVPIETILIPIDKKFTAGLSVKLNKRDLAKLVVSKTYDNLAIFNEEMLNANVAISGNVHNIKLDTIAIQFPGVGTINANGEINYILKRKNSNGHITFNGNVENIAELINSNTGNSNRDKSLDVTGCIKYKNRSIDASLTMSGGIGNIALETRYNTIDTVYKADVRIARLNIAEILPDVPLYNLTMDINAKGRGLNIFNEATGYIIEANIDTLNYSGYKLRAISAEAKQSNGISVIEVKGNDNNLRFDMQATTKLKAGALENNTTIKLAQADFKSLGITDAELRTSTQIDIAATSDLDETHTLRLVGKNTGITTNQHSFTPEDLELEFATTPENIEIKLVNGDLKADGRMKCGYTTLFTSLDKVAAMYGSIIDGKESYNLKDFERVLPKMDLHLECGKNNILHNYFAFNGINTESMNLDMTVSPTKGLDINGEIHKFSNSEIELENLKITTLQNGEILNYSVALDNISFISFEEENSYSATLNGTLSNYTATGFFSLRDNISKLDNRIGAKANFTPQKISLCFNSEALLFGTPFVFNEDNYINIGKGMSIEADVLFKNNENSGFHLYTVPGTKAKYNVNMDIFNVDLAKITGTIPGMPNIAGNLSANINCQGRSNSNRINCDLKVDSLAYEGNCIGNENIELAYSSKNNDDNNLGITLSHNNKNIANINCNVDIDNMTVSDGRMSLTRFPLEIANSFTNKAGVQLNGYVNSQIDFSGTIDKLLGTGYINFDSVYVYMPNSGTTLHPAEDDIKIENSLINFNRFYIYDKSNSPFVINGTVDITSPLNPLFNLRLNASNYEVINTPRTRGKSIYGKLFIDLRSFIRGTLKDLQMNGDVAILSNSDFAYVLPETAFETEKNLDGLVEFVNFNDSTSIVQEKPTEVDLGDIDANFNIAIKEGAKLALDFDETHENYIIFDGDGTLNATYDGNGLNVTGIYKLNSGDLKLTLPIIPLKTFHIQEGGRLTWTGDLYNPTLDITALEKTTVSVEFDDNSIQPTTFYTGVVLSNTVENMGIDFTMSSPDNIIQEQLNQLDKETLSKYAVAMIITGTYLGGRQGVTATSALSSFLDAKINDLSGEAIKNFDVNIGINDGLDAQTGSSYKNYSFSFSKRFLNDRITVVIGGEVNSGERPDRDASNNSIINNVSLEWKLNDSGNRYMRIFYDKNYRSILEGEITETGIGYVYKRKLNKLKELFNFKKKSTKKKATGKTNKKKSER